jgi:trehalose 6-phosphate phosphatase
MVPTDDAAITSRARAAPIADPSTFAATRVAICSHPRFEAILGALPNDGKPITGTAGRTKRIKRPAAETNVPPRVADRTGAHYRGAMHDASPAPLLPPPDPSAAGISLFLDFDGTLVEIAARHDGVVVDDSVRTLVRALAERLDGRLAIVSGRTAAEIVAYLHAADTAPPFAIAGSHGLELRWTDGRREAPAHPDALDLILTAFAAFAEAHPGVVMEEKPFGAALHYRGAPDAADACDAFASRLAAEHGLELQRGKMVAELRLAGGDKGDAVRRFMADPAMTGTTPIFLGDDITDEAGFVAAAALRGWGVQIGDTPLTTARYRLPDVAAVHRWLSHIAGVSA